ncbi:SulP family inorganic anion transporter [Methanobacterium sp. MBAC-LM]|uniref:SulP family inorganic anion transporter n=1 Tax=Methanobacterium sp. MBAC-LM TaxID=3412034 RepID=UPI003C74BD5F
MKKLNKLNLKNKFLLNGVLPLKAPLTSEIIAGLLLAAVGIPEVMGYAKIAGMPVITGLYTILLPIAIFAIFCSSRHLIVGADSATAAILSGTLVSIAAIGSPNYIALASTVALLCAVFLVMARVLRLGFIADFMSRTVLIGFLSGVGIQVAVSQLSNMLGISGEGGLNTIPQLINVFTHLFQINIPTLILSIIVVAIIVGTRRISHKIPGALIAVVGTAIASFLFDLQGIGISILGHIPSGLPTFGIPPVDISILPNLMIAAVSCFIVILSQSTATARSFTIRYSESIDEDKDIFALGLANGIAGLTGTFVVNGSPTKTEIVDNAGSRTQMSSLVTATAVFIVLLFLTKPMSFLPSATLAGIVFVIGANMVDISHLKDIRHKVKSEYFLAIITAATVIVIGVLWGIVLSIVLSIILHLSHSYRPTNSIFAKDKKGEWAFEPVKTGKSTKEGLLIYRFNRDLYFANSDKLKEEVLKLVDSSDPHLKLFVLNTAGFSGVDYTSAEMFKDLYRELKERNIKFALTSMLPDLKDQFDHLGLTRLIGEENIYENVLEALEAYESGNY